MNLRETQQTSKLNINSLRINVNDIVLVFLMKRWVFWGFFNWDSLHARLDSHYKAWSYKKKKHKKITAHRKSV